MRESYQPGDTPAMDHDPTTVRRPERDGRVTDAKTFLQLRRIEAEKMCELWERSRAPDAADNLAYWKDVLKETEGKIRRLDEG